MLALIALATLALLGLTSSASAAGMEIEPGTARVTTSTSQAGAHPDVVVEFRIAPDDTGERPVGSAHTTVVELPPGLIGNPTNFASCSMQDVVRMMNMSGPNQEACPREAAVGFADLDVRFPLAPAAGLKTWRQRIFRITTNPDEPAVFGTSILSLPIRMIASVRSDGDYGLTITAPRLHESAMLRSFRGTFWGVPADHQGGGADATMSDGSSIFDPGVEGWRFGGRLPGAQRKPFMTNPGYCPGTPLGAGISASAWAEPAAFSPVAIAPIGPITGCEKLEFEPQIAVAPENGDAGQPSGYRVDLTVPQTNEADVLATPNLKDAVVRLPQGVALSAPVANGLQSCTDAQLAIDSKQPETCPDASKIGTVEIDSPLLDEHMQGSIYTGEQLSGDPESGAMYRLFLTAYEAGVRIKLRGAISVDRSTGQITATFDDNPQLPFARLTLRLKSGDRAVLVNPQACGTHTTDATLTSWGGQSKSPFAQFGLDRNCAGGGFAPSFTAGVDNAGAGESPSFHLRVTRGDGEQGLSTIETTLPAGLLAHIGDIPLCGDAEAAAGACSAASKIGSTTVGVGTGRKPLYLPQSGKAPTAVYLGGPYKGAPYSLVIVVPAQAGPFDLGTVVVRAALFIDQATTQVTVKADPLPAIVGGVPLNYRDVRVAIDKPAFMVNPTSCDVKSVTGSLGSTGGTAVAASSRFQVGDCGTLPFKPKLTLRVGERGKTGNRRMPPLDVTLSMSRGQANNRGVRVTLPRAFNSRLRVINDACSLEEFHAGQAGCKQVGTAVAKTPLLQEPLLGRAFFVKHPERRLPDLMVALQGQGSASLVKVNLTGKVVIPRNLSLRTDFDTVPDVPIDSFTLSLQGGRNGVIGNIGNICSAKVKRGLKAGVVFTAQSGKRVARQQKMVVAGCGKAAKRAAGKKKSAGKKKAAGKKVAKR